MLKRIALIGAVLTSPAFAADLPSRKAAPLPPVAETDWTGFHAGLFGGGLFGGTNGTLLAVGNAGAVSYVGAQQVPTWNPLPFGANIPVGLNDGGAEWMFAQNWSAKIEYLYSNLGTTTIQTGAIAAFGNWTGVQSALVKAPFSAPSTSPTSETSTTSPANNAASKTESKS